MEIVEIFSAEIVSRIRKDIKKNIEQEIFLLGKMDPVKKKIVDYDIMAKDNYRMVVENISQLKSGDMIIHNHSSGDLLPCAADIKIASLVDCKEIGFAIINNQVDNVYILIEPKIPQEDFLLNADEILSFFKPRGELEKHLDNFEYRAQQVNVVSEIISSFNKQEFNFIEAGTGTGKSFAYLIPALFWAKLNKKVVVISTNTINLQEQLINKDLVLLKKVLPFSFKSVLVKGRRNYLCKRKLHNLEERVSDLFKDEQEKKVEFIKIINWLETAKTGTKSELNFMLKTDIWDDIASETDLCLRTNCPFFDSCYFMSARKEVFSADLLIVNHHLLISDAILKNESPNKNIGIIPKYTNLIIDEAHNFSESATSHLGRPFYYQTINKFLQRLFQNKYSFIPSLRTNIMMFDFFNRKDVLDIIDKKIIPQMQRVTDICKEYFNQLKVFNSNNEEALRITAEQKNSDSWLSVQEMGENLKGNLNNLESHFKELYEEMSNLDDSVIDNFAEQFIELESAIIKCHQFCYDLEFNIEAEADEYVFWLEGGGKKFINQENAPLKIAAMLQKILWSFLDNLVVTSATLTINNSFIFFEEMLGLQEAKNLLVESPFDYKKQAEVLIPKDIPAANSSKFLPTIIEDLKKMLISFAGRTMVLFTSYNMLNSCVKKTEAILNANGLNLLPQGRYSRKYILDHFKFNEQQIIFGTVSFWEGVDLKGDNLQYLIIMKLPFSVPNEPISQARMEQIRKEGKNPFINYSLPMAVIRFKQGFGRLIRSNKDKGLVIVLDNRLISKSYGKIFLNSLPVECPIKKLPIKNIVQRGSSFVNE